MKLVRALLTFVLGISLLMPTIATADVLDEIIQRGVLRVGLEPGYMPFELTNQRGEIIGFDVDIARRMANAMGVKLELVSTAWDGIIPALLTEKFDIIMSGMTLTQQRNLTVNFANPYIVVGQTVLIRKEIADEVKSYRDLNKPKFKVSSKLGTTGEQAVQRMIPQAEYVSFESEQEAVLDMLNGKVHAVVYDLPLLSITNAQRNDGNLVFLDEPFTHEPLAWAIRRGNYDFLNWLNNFLNQIKSDGTYEQIYNKWFVEDQWLKQIQN